MTTSSAEDVALLATSVREAAAVRGPRPFLSDDGMAGTDERLWTVLSQQIGLSGLVVPEEYDGAGAGMQVLVAALGELGATLAPVPGLTSAGMAPCMLLAAGVNDEGSTLLGRLARGEVTATVAWAHHGAPGSSELRLTTGADGAHVSGQCSFVLDGSTADVVIVAATTESGVVLVSVPTDAPDVERVPMKTLDLTRGMASFRFEGAAATVVTSIVSEEALSSAVDLAVVCIAAEMVGIAAECLDRAVAWAKERVQFGRPIGSYQAIKHTLVDLLMEVELARSALDVAASAAADLLETPGDDERHALVTAASMAKALCGDAVVKVADEALHIFGGIGFTWEHDAHLYLRRAKTLELLLGDPGLNRHRLAASLGVG